MEEPPCYHLRKVPLGQNWVLPFPCSFHPVTFDSGTKLSGYEPIWILPAGSRPEGSTGKGEQGSTGITPIPHDESWVQPQVTCADTDLLSHLAASPGQKCYPEGGLQLEIHTLVLMYACTRTCTHANTHMYTHLCYVRLKSSNPIS